MATEAKESKCAIVEVKSEPTDFAIILKSEPDHGYSAVDVALQREENAVTIKEEDFMDVADGETHNKDDLDLILKKHHICKICKKSFPQSVDLTRHQKTHYDHIPRSIGYKRTAKNNGYKRTTRNSCSNRVVILRKKKHKCEICNRCFKIRKNMMKHLQTHPTGLSVIKTNYKCEICNKCFAKPINLSSHRQIHATERNYKCEICPKRFKTFNIHTSERDHKCEFCGKGFVQRYQLAEHVRVHTGEKNYKCELCDKRYTTKGNLSKQSKVHMGILDYQCKVCEKFFVTNSILVRHLKVHSRKSYKCGVCDKAFTTQDSLTRHVKVHTGGGHFQCTVCERRFSRKKELVEHEKVHDTDGRDQWLLRDIEKCFIKEETFEIDGIVERKSTPVIGDVIKEDKPNLTDLQLETFNDIIIKQEENTMDAPSLISTYELLDIKNSV